MKDTEKNHIQFTKCLRGLKENLAFLASRFDPSLLYSLAAKLLGRKDKQWATGRTEIPAEIRQLCTWAGILPLPSLTVKSVNLPEAYSCQSRKSMLMKVC